MGEDQNPKKGYQEMILPRIPVTNEGLSRYAPSLKMERHPGGDGCILGPRGVGPIDGEIGCTSMSVSTAPKRARLVGRNHFFVKKVSWCWVWKIYDISLGCA